MDRMGCVDVPALPLQLLVRRNPDWRGHPAAVAAEDRAQAALLWISEAAYRGGVRRGMRCAAAMSLLPSLRAGTVAPDEIAAAIAALVERLQRFTPRVEPPCAGKAAAGKNAFGTQASGEGVFHLDASGLTRLFPSMRAWAEAIRDDLAAQGFVARLAVGFTRFGARAAALTAREIVVFEDPEEEARAARNVPLARLGLAPSLLASMERLGVTTVADLLRLPEDGLGLRFGDEARALHRLASGARGMPLRPQIVEPPPAAVVPFEFPETDTMRLLFAANAQLAGLLGRLAARGEALRELAIALRLDGAGSCDGKASLDERLRPAAPTLDAGEVMDLVRLRVPALRLVRGVTEMSLTAFGSPASSAQIELFAERPRRDPAAAARAFTRLRAEFGDDVVVVARLAEGHLPEAGFRWEPLSRPATAHPGTATGAPLVRRLFAKPQPLRALDRHEPDGLLVPDLGARPGNGSPRGPVVVLAGPYVLAGGWWRGAEIRREVHFAEIADGRVLWAYFDVPRRRWFLLGTVE